MHPLLYLVLIFTCCNAGQDDRALSSPSQHLVTYVGTQKFKNPGQTTLNATYFIANPGTYVLTEDILSQASTGQVVSIATNNVTFDLGGKSITLGTGSGSPIDAFTLSPGLSNITIKNGTINNMNGNGITIAGGCTNITLENIFINGCVIGGIICSGTAGKPINNCFFNNCYLFNNVATNTDSFGIKLSYSSYFTIAKCTVNGQQAIGATKNSYGIYANNSSNIRCIDCLVQGTSSTTLSAGYYLENNCTESSFINSDATSIVSSGTNSSSKAYGFFESSCSNTRFENCKSINASSYTLSAGFYTQNSTCSSYVSSTSNNNVCSGPSGTTGAYGFLVDTGKCFGISFDDCKACANQGSTDTNGQGCGFSLDNCFYCTIQNTTAQANHGGNGQGIGIHIGANATRCIIKNNSLFANTSSLTKKAYGILDEGLTSSTMLINNLSCSNRDESLVPIDQNYMTVYALTNALQTATKNNTKNLSASLYLNTSITP